MCYSEGQAHLDYDQTSIITLPNGTSYTSGYAMICSSDYVYAPICNSTVNDALAALVCSSLGYSDGFAGILYGSPDNYYPVLSNNGVFDYYCPEYASYTGDCDFNITPAGGCTEHGGDALITCAYSASG